jgi:ATP-dependent Lon protease
MLVAQKAAAKDEPKAEDLYDIGCVSTILQMLKLPDGTVKVLVEGRAARIPKVREDSIDGEHFVAEVLPISPDAASGSEIEALRRAVVQQFDQYVKLNKKIPPEILTSIAGIDEPGRLADTIAAHLPLKLEAKQAVLDLFDVAKRSRSCSNCSSTRSTSCRSRSASVAASSGRWRRASASTT